MEPPVRIEPGDLGIGDLFYEIRDAVVVAEASSQRIVLWNPAAEVILGWSQEEAIQLKVEDLVPPELKERHRFGISRYARTGTGDLVTSNEPALLPSMTKSGEVIEVEIVFAPIAKSPDGGRYIAAFVRDVTERRHLEKEAEEALTNLRLILESTGEGIYGLDIQGICTFANLAAAEMLGYQTETLVGSNMHELVHHSREDGTPYPVDECPIARSFRIGRGCHVDDEVMWRKDGTPIPVRYSAFPIIKEGHVTGAVVSMTDVTNRRRLEGNLRNANTQLQAAYDRERDAVQELQALDQLKNDFVAMVAHDLKSPMTVIGGLADTMINRWERIEDERKIEFLGLISRNIFKLADLVDDVLQVARIESNQISYEIAPFDLASLVRRTARESLPGETTREIVVEATEGLPLALADEQRVWQVLTNLYSNALKFSPAHQPVEVSVVHQDDDLLRVSVRDHGGGIRPEELPKLFQKFSRLTQTGDEIVKGTGLGLFICKRMIEEQGGDIWAESVLDEGSTFSFTLPVAPGEGS